MFLKNEDKIIGKNIFYGRKLVYLKNVYLSEK